MNGPLLSAPLDAAALTDAARRRLRPDTNSVDVAARLASLPADAVDITFAPGRVDFAVASAFPSEERRGYFTNRWLATVRFFARVRQICPELAGTCRLWLDDIPPGPGLAFCGNSDANVLMPDAEFLATDGYAPIRREAAAAWVPWAWRAEPIFWRGASTGLFPSWSSGQWHDLPRVRLCMLARSSARPDLFDVALSRIVQFDDPAVVAEIRTAGIVREPVPLLDFIMHRHSVDIDGNSASWAGLFTKMLLGVTTLKVASDWGWRQWYYDRLVPWQHFVPVSAEMNDLGEMAEWLIMHPQEARAIAERGRALADEITFEAAVRDTAPAICALMAGSMGRVPVLGDTAARAAAPATDESGTEAADAPAAPPATAWTDSPVVARHLCVQSSGDPSRGWVEHVCDRYLHHGVARALSLGCGSGALERDLRSLHACAHVDGLDPDAAAIVEARQLAVRAGITGLSYAVADLNALALPSATYDAVFSSCSIHRVAHLEQLFAAVARTLKPGGVWAMVEYVGPSRFQHTDTVVALVNGLLQRLPAACRERASRPGRYVERFRRQPVERMRSAAPKQAVRSAEILPLLGASLTVLEERPLGGTLLQPLLEDIAQNFDPSDDDRAALLDTIIFLEKTLIDSGVLESDFRLIVSTPRVPATTR